MADFSDLMTATRAIVDPITSGADLAQIAQAQPSLWPQVAGHPNAYPELLTWLDNNGDAATKQAVAVSRVSHPGRDVSYLPVEKKTAGDAMSQRRLRKSWVIGGVALIVALAVGVSLIVVSPWQTRSSNPVLTTVQFGAIFAAPQDGKATHPFGDWQVDNSSFVARLQQYITTDNCGLSSAVTLTGVTACAQLGGNFGDDYSGASFPDGTIVLLFDTVAAAHEIESWSPWFENAESVYGSMNVRLSGPIYDHWGPWVIGYGQTMLSPSPLWLVAVYGNVAVLNGGSDAKASTWQRWQDSAVSLGRAIDQAARS
ncbi:MAG: hypothetical protein FWF36_03260 [Propionibacteriaceae bacterium]|nr:hypothetical protein [Propionibacteriaceae bacterium]